MKASMSGFKCSRMFVIVSAILLVMMGIVSLAISIWMVTSNNWATIFSYQINLLCTFMIVAACIMILGGFYGGYAAYKSSNTHLSLFFGVMIVAAILLMVSGVLGIALPLRVITAGCGSPIYPVVSGLNITATQAINTICQNCTCYINTTQMPVDLTGYSFSTTLTSAPVRAQDCANWSKTAYDDLYVNLQNSFSCAGWCPGTQGVIYKMTSVNNGVPSTSCFEATTSWFQTFSRTIAICAFLFGGLIVVLLALLWWHLCQLVDLETQWVMTLLGRWGTQQNIISMNNTIEMSQMNYPQPMLPMSEPVSPRQIQFNAYPHPYPSGSFPIGNYPTANYPPVNIPPGNYPPSYINGVPNANYQQVPITSSVQPNYYGPGIQMSPR